MNRLLFSALLVCAGPVLAQDGQVKVEAADGDWSKLPQLDQRGYDHLDSKLRQRLYEIAGSKQCPSFALKQGRLDFRVGFAVQYDATGKLTRLIMPQLHCAEAEGITGGALLEMIQAGDYTPTGKSQNGWYQGTLGFSFADEDARAPAVVVVQAQPGALKGPDQTEIVCEKVREIGSRLSVKQVCMTRAEWAARKKDDRDAVERAQTQRGCQDTAC
jgi:hypothetical protein